MSLLWGTLFAFALLVQGVAGLHLQDVGQSANAIASSEGSSDHKLSVRRSGSSGSEMLPDTANDDKKCGEPGTLGAANRVFDLRSETTNVNEATCSAECLSLSTCVAYSGVWGNFGTIGYWCIGCSVALSVPHTTGQWALAYIKTSTGASGDPYLTNIKGEHFDVLHTGRMLLLEVPQANTSKTRKLAVEANIERMGLISCGPTFITQVFLDGAWLDTPVSIRSGHTDKHKFMGIQFGKEDWIPHAEFIEKKIGKMKVQKIGLNEQAFALTVEGVSVRVARPQRPRNFLDVQISGLGQLQESIGGLLGLDSHEQAATLPNECNGMLVQDHDYESAGSAVASL